MKKKTIVGLIAIVAIAAVVIFAGCIGGPEGRYVQEGHPDNYLDINHDGTFYLMEEGKSISGTWTIEENRIYLTTTVLGTSSTLQLTIEGNTITSIVATIYPADKKDFRFLNSSSLSNSNRRTLSLSHGISRFD